MTVKIIYITRHGYRSNWLPHGPYPQPPTGVNSDFPLAEHGLDQAKELAHYLLSIDNQPELLFSSPFFRCLQTAEPIAEMLELPIYTDRGISEWYKPDREVIPEPAGFDVLSNFFPEKLKEDWEPSVIPSKNGESEEEIFDRCKSFWHIFISRVEARFPDVENIMLVTHAATKIALGMSLLGFNNCRQAIDGDGTIIRSGACSLDKYELLNQDDDINFDQRHWKMTMNGNTEFLKHGEEMHWDFRSGFEAGSDADIKARQNRQRGEGDPSAESADSEEVEHVYLSLDIPNHNYRERNEVDHTATLQYSGLEQDRPLIKIGDNLYQGSWKKLVGTELAFPDAATTKRRVNDQKHEDTSGYNDEQGLNKTAITEQKDISERIYRIVDHLELTEVEHV
ncbi:uncharacterized protein Ecym_5417 [Eremothecium cymbalariae DBVPG|uniref:Transcription factor TFIIIC triple barrel domain-containing protein n=1 Tax=Eremothecium cymbalariae (strain CBS 270.75 / DBVPG 7215 / KCTC 17166 / NRRL Y-17582) TaxID=931890 RepID=I6NDM9_ERECY|nr:hypothetical protein Ecym_5417 [Eremothecium cymbalariae DBVPG\